MSCVALCKLLNLSEFPFPDFKQSGCFTGRAGTSLEPRSGRDEMPAPSAGQAQRPLGVRGTADATRLRAPAPLARVTLVMDPSRPKVLGEAGCSRAPHTGCHFCSLLADPALALQLWRAWRALHLPPCYLLSLLS